VIWLFLAAAGTVHDSARDKYEMAVDALSMLRKNADENRYLEPAQFMQRLMDRRGWDLFNASR
jgi:hypothetical protein